MRGRQCGRQPTRKEVNEQLRRMIKRGKLMQLKLDSREIHGIGLDRPTLFNYWPLIKALFDPRTTSNARKLREDVGGLHSTSPFHSPKDDSTEIAAGHDSIISGTLADDGQCSDHTSSEDNHEQSAHVTDPREATGFDEGLDFPQEKSPTPLSSITLERCISELQSINDSGGSAYNSILEPVQIVATLDQVFANMSQSITRFLSLRPTSKLDTSGLTPYANKLSQSLCTVQGEQDRLAWKTCLSRIFNVVATENVLKAYAAAAINEWVIMDEYEHFMAPKITDDRDVLNVLRLYNPARFKNLEANFAEVDDGSRFTSKDRAGIDTYVIKNGHRHLLENPQIRGSSPFDDIHAIQYLKNEVDDTLPKVARGFTIRLYEVFCALYPDQSSLFESETEDKLKTTSSSKHRELMKLMKSAFFEALELKLNMMRSTSRYDSTFVTPGRPFSNASMECDDHALEGSPVQLCLRPRISAWSRSSGDREITTVVKARVLIKEDA
ncbi:hypothetical protein H2200_009822 [Cladophialophora chaetospira]|uniref:Uncharacterized protein n=1 Tax=Cladophialophora chaetospira TaxID=386627 RepID=A0AA38X354_9EURO|nr:hypothetical protein H2200_009822 [Cladophialophora chaetospira]